MCSEVAVYLTGFEMLKIRDILIASLWNRDKIHHCRVALRILWSAPEQSWRATDIGWKVIRRSFLPFPSVNLTFLYLDGSILAIPKRRLPDSCLSPDEDHGED